MSQIKITESANHNGNIIYIYRTLCELISQMGAKASVVEGNNRSSITIEYPDSYKELFILEVEDRIADIIAINYKYNFFNKQIITDGLDKNSREFLIMALISADLDEDKKYIIKKIKDYDEYSIDGIYHFRLSPLVGKWQEIVSYIPQNFERVQLADFIGYLIKDKRGKKVVVENGKVYDMHYNILRRRQLVDFGEDDGILKEIILSGCGEIELSSKLSNIEERYLRELYGDKIIFADGYFAKKD